MWLYVPEMSYRFAPESVGLNLESSSLSDFWEKTLAASATWRGKPQPPQAWSRRWKAGGFIRHLSGLTFSPSTLALGVASFISSLQETPAKTTASLESAPALTENGSLPLKSFGSLMSAGLILSSARTSRGTRTDSLRPSSRHWSDWATALRQEYSVRQKPEIPCGASDCSSWPSASVMDTGDNTDLAKIQARRQKHKARAMNGNGFGMSLGEASRTWHAPRCNDPEKRGEITDDPRNGLAGQSENWSSPKASDPEKAGPNMRGSKGDVPLPGQAAQWMAPAVPNGGRTASHAIQKGNTLTNADGEKVQLGLEHQAKQWSAPRASDMKGSTEGSMFRQDGTSRDDMLQYQAEQFFRLPSSQDQPIAGGSMSSIDGPNSNQPSAKRKLNPIFVEALMRWPTGLSGFERLEMAWTQWWLVMPIYLSELCSRPTPQQATLF